MIYLKNRLFHVYGKNADGNKKISSGFKKYIEVAERILFMKHRTKM